MTSEESTAPASRASGATRAYAIGIRLLLLVVVAQFLLAGLGVFADSSFFFWHAAIGSSAVLVLSLLLVGIGRLGGVPGRTLWLTAAVAGLVLVQSLLLVPYHMAVPTVVRTVSGLHVVNALLIFWIVVRLFERT